jgi:hypothetical protein
MIKELIQSQEVKFYGDNILLFFEYLDYDLGDGGDTNLFFVEGWRNPKIIEAHKKLEQQGFLKIIQKKEEWLVEFTKKANPYLLKVKSDQETRTIKDKEMYRRVLLVDIDKIEVTGITSPSDAEGKKECIVEYNIYFSLTAFGKAYDFKSEDLTKKGREVLFTLYDNGWRISKNSIPPHRDD